MKREASRESQMQLQKQWPCRESCEEKEYPESSMVRRLTARTNPSAKPTGQGSTKPRSEDR